MLIFRALGIANLLSKSSLEKGANLSGDAFSLFSGVVWFSVGHVCLAICCIFGVKKSLICTLFAALKSIICTTF